MIHGGSITVKAPTTAFHAIYSVTLNVDNVTVIEGDEEIIIARLV